MLKTRLILPLAFASVAFMYGCQEQGSSPVGPEGSGPLLHTAHAACEAHNKNDAGCGDDPEDPVDATFTVSFGGDVVGGSDVDGGFLFGPNGGKNVLQTAFQDFVMLDLPGFRKTQGVIVTNGDKCFLSGNIKSAVMQVSQVTPSDTDNAIIRFFFTALGTAGEPDVDYVLTVLATFDDPGNWPPAIGEENEITITGTSFVLAHVNGPGRKFACTGEGNVTDDDFDFNLTVTRN